MVDSAEIDVLLNACRVAASEDSLATALEELAAAISNTEKRIRDEIALFLIRQVVIIGTPPNLVTTSLDKCLDACGPDATVGSCSQVFLEAASVKIESPCPLETSFRTVRRLMLSMPEFTDGPPWVQHLNMATMENIVSMALLVPTQIANACHFQKIVLPTWCVRSRYLPRLVECALAMDALAKSPEADLYVHILVQTIVRSGASDEAAIALYHYYHEFNPDLNWFQNTTLATIHSLAAPRDSATLLRSILRLSTAKVQCTENQTVGVFCQEYVFPYLDLVCRPVLQASRDVQDAFVQLSILSSSSCGTRTDNKSDLVFCHCVAMLLAACENSETDDESSDDEDGLYSGKQTTVLERHLYEVAACWSETVFVQRTEMALQHHVTNFIRSAVSMLDKEETDHFMEGKVLYGVRARLQSSIHKVRRDGMKVGEALAEQMEQSLKFEETDDGHEAPNEEPFVKDETVPAEMPSGKGKTRMKACRKKASKQVDPDAEYISDEDTSDSYESFEDTYDGASDDDSIWDDYDELIPYNLDDDEEDLREIPIPLYLRECLDMLRTPDVHEMAFNRQETGLETVSSLVRSNPSDLPDLTVPLCRAIVTLENKTDLPEFRSNLTSGLLSLTVMQPILTGECLINEFFDESRGLFMRLLILSTFEQAAIELCGAKALKEGREKRDSER